MAKKTTKDLVSAHIEELRTMTHGELFKWSCAQGLDSSAGFSAFKKALLAHGIDYNALRSGSQLVKQAEAEIETKAAASVVLYSDAKAHTGRYAICDKNGEPVWYGKFFSDDRDYNGEQSSGEMAAAKKAVWLAARIKEAVGAQAIRLTLKVDAQWLVHANEVAAGGDRGGGKARELRVIAQRLGIVLYVEPIQGKHNPADKYTVCDGFKKWQETDLRTLLDKEEEAVC